MGCSCGKKKAASQPKKIISRPPQTKPNIGQQNMLKRVIRRSVD